MNQQMNEWMNEWMNKWMMDNWKVFFSKKKIIFSGGNGWMNEQMNEQINE